MRENLAETVPDGIAAAGAEGADGNIVQLLLEQIGRLNALVTWYEAELAEARAQGPGLVYRHIQRQRERLRADDHFHTARIP